MSSYFSTRRLTEPQARDAHMRIYHHADHANDRMTSHALGGAAAYEVFLIWDRDLQGIYDGLSRRENRSRLVALAVGEGTFLLCLALRNALLMPISQYTPSGTASASIRTLQEISPSKTPPKQLQRPPNTSLTITTSATTTATTILADADTASPAAAKT